ncbi:MAG: Asp-tRNA(Asn)/Glu-tRNA(Gln) amidotransferase subunit GatB [Actinobacteria bacterium]|nr:Asp-tRNA(Asn)/Glu-tRNA(Gln) amidotransferase subunit GatB [Actinomycetota bacterium]MCB9390757.1 Asp-tRNA(Asn)/Glu-tRNA(Gln) amidotransferase subunit GatB [Acidimicrobiia bacterium]
MDGWEPVIGLEVHVELKTATKMFCGCRNEFGGAPNTHICPVCLGLPGSLPVLNRQAVEFAMRVGYALNLNIPERSVFHRKNYFYPDMPKDFQTSQYDEPITEDGWIDIEGVRIGIERAHLEEDTGKSTHVGTSGRIHGAEYSLIDYNRAGVPLLEIVSRPDIRSAAQARAYVAELRAVLFAIGVSDVKMEEGSMRVDANISVRPVGRERFGTRAEIKNMNSLRSLERAVDYEIRRQITELESGGTIVQETRHWNEDDGRTHSMRSKEGADDYRYFPEPDLVPVAPSLSWREEVAAQMPELPAQRRARLVERWGISADDADVLVAVAGLADYAESAVDAGADPVEVTKWVTGDLLGRANESGLSPAEWKVTPHYLTETLALVADGTLSRNLAKTVLDKVWESGDAPSVVVDREGMAQVSDSDELGGLVDALLAEHPDDVVRYREGDEKSQKKLLGFFMGQLMKQTRGQGNPGVLNQLLRDKLNGA